MDDAQLLRYSRHLLLDEIGIEGQRRLLASTALVVGAGGLGSPVALYLASAGVGRIVIADGDTVDLTNLQRQIAHGDASVGRPKADSARAAMLALNPTIEVTALDERLEGDALERAVAASDVVLDCSDNWATRHAVNRACVRHRVPLVSGAGVRFDGQLAVFDPRHGDSPCYACVFPPGAAVEDVRCATLGVFAPLVGVIGSLQASEALKLLAGIGPSLAGELRLFDARSGGWTTMKAARDPRCPVCGARPTG